MGSHGRIQPAPARIFTLRVLRQIAEVDAGGRLGAIREVVSVEHRPDRQAYPFALTEHVSRFGLL